MNYRKYQITKEHVHVGYVSFKKKLSRYRQFFQFAWQDLS